MSVASGLKDTVMVGYVECDDRLFSELALIMGDQMRLNPKITTTGLYSGRGDRLQERRLVRRPGLSCVSGCIFK